MCSDPRSQKGALDPLELELPELVSCQESNSILSYSKTHYRLLSLLWVCGHPEIHQSDHEHILTKTRLLRRDCCQGFPQDTGFPNVAKIHFSRGFIKAKTIKLYSFLQPVISQVFCLSPAKHALVYRSRNSRSLWDHVAQTTVSLKLLKTRELQNNP